MEEQKEEEDEDVDVDKNDNERGENTTNRRAETRQREKKTKILRNEELRVEKRRAAELPERLFVAEASSCHNLAPLNSPYHHHKQSHPYRVGATSFGNRESQYSEGSLPQTQTAAGVSNYFLRRSASKSKVKSKSKPDRRRSPSRSRSRSRRRNPLRAPNKAWIVFPTCGTTRGERE